MPTVTDRCHLPQHLGYRIREKGEKGEGVCVSADIGECVCVYTNSVCYLLLPRLINHFM
jgi:hypothetical protein